MGTERGVGATFGSSRRLLRGLRELGDVAAPPSLAGAVLAVVGLEGGYWHLDTPLGRAYVAYGPQGVRMVALADDDGAFERSFQARFRRSIRPVAEPPARLARQVEEQMKGGRTGQLRYDLHGLTEFERAVLLKALEIPRGEVRPYAWIAREIGNPGAVRAVGSALKNNPVPLLIPCHRVVKSGGKIGNYALGPDAKRAVLEMEGLDVEAWERLARGGVRYVGSDSTGIYCFPTCRHARRVTDRHRVLFGSGAAAAAAGYRPCKVCRPATALQTA